MPATSLIPPLLRGLRSGRESRQVVEGSLDSCWNCRRGRQVGSLGHEAVLVRGVGEGDGAIGALVAEGALGRGPRFWAGHASALLSLDTVSGLVSANK